MDSQPITVTWAQLSWFVGGACAVVGATTAGIWVLMTGHTRHWKDLHDAKEKELEATRKELENSKVNPKMLAMNLISKSEEIFSEEIAKLQKLVQTLKAACKAKDEVIERLKRATQASEDELVQAEETKENLQRKIRVYENAITNLFVRKSRATEALLSFRSGEFDIEVLERSIEEEILGQIRNIDATSFKKTQEAAMRASIQVESKKNLQLKKKMADLAQAEAKAETRMRRHLSVPKPDKSSR